MTEFRYMVPYFTHRISGYRPGEEGLFEKKIYTDEPELEYRNCVDGVWTEWCKIPLVEKEIK